MKPIKIGVLGCSRFATNSMIPGIIRNKNFKLSYIASREEEKASYFATQFDCKPAGSYQALLDTDVDAIYSPLPTGLQFEWIAKALKSGKHVFAEKSLTDGYDNVAELMRMASQHQRCLFENFMFVHHAQFRFVKEFIESERLGPIRSFHSAFGIPMFENKEDIRYQKALSGGALNDLGAYTLMGARLMLGPDHHLVGCRLQNLGQEVDFSGSIQLESEKGIISQLTFGFDHHYQNTMELWMQQGKITVQRAYTAKPGFKPTITVETATETKHHQLQPDDQMQKMLDQFHRAIVSNNIDEQFDQITSHHILMDKVRKNG